MENINFMKRDYEEMVQAARDTFKDVLNNYSARNINAKDMLERDDIRFEIVEAMVDRYFYYTTHPFVQEISNNKESYFGAYNELCELLYHMAEVAFISIEEEVM